MKITVTRPPLFLLVFLLVIITNSVVLFRVATNRSTETESEVTLSERELTLPYHIHQENSGLALRLIWRILPRSEDYLIHSAWRSSPAWFTHEKLEELGFNLTRYSAASRDSAFYRQPVPKEVFIVLEYNGQQYREALKRATSALDREKKALHLHPDDKQLRENFAEAEERLKKERFENSRLFALDAGLDAATLREKYGDKNRFIITKGLVEPTLNSPRDKEEIVGILLRLSVDHINVPLHHKKFLNPFADKSSLVTDNRPSPHYQVLLAYGKHQEPWIISIKTQDGRKQ